VRHGRQRQQRHRDAHRAALGIVIVGREGTSPRALTAADLIAQSITEALDLLLDAQALNATLRS
jgi:soluble P-type ATPase